MKKIRLRLIFTIIGLMSLFTVWASYPLDTMAQSTRTIKACHICEEVGTDSTPTRILSNKVGEILFEPDVVKALLFWSEGCPHCMEVKNFTIPQVEKQYGNQLSIRKIELRSRDEMDVLLMIGINHGLDGNQIGVPFLIIGDDILVGSKDIPDKLPEYIEKYLKRGGVGLPDLPELAAYLPVSTSIAPTPIITRVGITPLALITDTPVPAAGEPCASCEVMDMKALSVTLTNIAVQMEQAATKEPLPNAQRSIVIHLFWGEGCPHCEQAKPFLEQLEREYDHVDLRMYEVYNDTTNRAFFTKMSTAFGFEPHAVPTIFIGDRYWEGYNPQIQREIRLEVERCQIDNCIDAAEKMDSSSKDLNPDAENSELVENQTGEKVIELPLIGSVDLSSKSLMISTLLIAFVDGFNPCSVWVLTMLLALTLHTGSRKKVLLIGFIFLTVATAVYGLFIAGLFTMFSVISFVGWIQILVAAVALFFAIVNIKDYFFYQEGLSLTISDDKKPGIYKRMRRLMDSGQSFWALVGGTIVLSAGVSLVEFSCTAGFPVLWTNLLASQHVPMMTFVLLLLVYLAVYQLDEMAIFLFAVFTMRASKLEEKQGRILKLIGGMLMLAIAAVMLIDPSLMNNLSSSLIVFGIAFGATIIILLVHRTVLPKYGILIGTEFQKRTVKKNRSKTE